MWRAVDWSVRLLTSAVYCCVCVGWSGFAFDMGGSSWNVFNWTQRASAARDTLYWLDTHRQSMWSVSVGGEAGM